MISKFLVHKTKKSWSLARRRQVTQRNQNSKNNTSKDFVTLTPGIRPFGEDTQDQKRVATIDMAKDEWSDFIVVGRPIYQSKEPASVVERILKKL